MKTDFFLHFYCLHSNGLLNKKLIYEDSKRFLQIRLVVVPEWGKLGNSTTDPVSGWPHRIGRLEIKRFSILYTKCDMCIFVERLINVRYTIICALQNSWQLSTNVVYSYHISHPAEVNMSTLLVQFSSFLPKSVYHSN